MGRELDFAEILESKMVQGFKASEPTYNEGEFFSGNVENPLWKDLLTWKISCEIQSAPRGRGYPPPPPPKPHSYNPHQLISWNWLNGQGAALGLGFRKSELQKAYRRLALVFHSDRPHGSVSRFIELRGHYERLLALFPVTK